MLVEFRVENHRSIQEEQAITFEIGSAIEPSDPRLRTVGRKRLLPVVALYGANASGKSNLLDALNYMRVAVVESHRLGRPDGGVERDPFAWGRWRQRPTMLEVKFLIEGVEYQYGFVADDERFLEEWLYASPRGRKQIWFERDGGEFKFGDHLRGENKLVEQVTRDNALFLSTAAQLGQDQLAPIYGWFRSIRTANIHGRHGLTGPSLRFHIRGLHGRSQPSLFEDGRPAPEYSAFRKLLLAADVGIEDLRLDNRQIEVRHTSEEVDAWLPLYQESAGTQMLFENGPCTIEALQSGSLLLVDELEASLHPLLARGILDLFNTAESNPNNAQLLFTTHDTNLLGTLGGDPMLRRDQVWLTEKSREGATCVYPLTDFKPRKGENLERGYLQGRYGAVPYLGSMPIPHAED